MTEQHHQGPEGNTPSLSPEATQPGDPGAAPPNADLSSDGAAPGNLFADLHHYLRYEDGRLYWRVSPRYGISPGEEAGCAKGGARKGTRRHHVHLLGRSYLRSRLVYFMHHGRWPEPTCDHIDQDTTNDRIENLREADLTLQQMNAGKKRDNGLPKGVKLNPKSRRNPYRVCISCFGGPVEASFHPTLEAAAARASEVYAGLPR